MRLCTLYCYIRCRGAAADTRVSSYCVFILHPEMSRISRGVASYFPSDLGYRRSATLSSDLGYGGSATLSSDLGYGGSATLSSDLGYGDSSTSAASTHSTSHPVKRYQKMTMRPHEEGRL